MKSLLCTIVKNENKYLNEWVEYNKNIGFDSIILYDNNDIHGETINLSQYPFVQIVDFRGRHRRMTNNKTDLYYGIQEEAYNECYHNHSKDYDWIAFFDVDEFIKIDNGLTINEFLSQDKFKSIECIQLNWEIYGDNENVKYNDKPLLERFIQGKKFPSNIVKSIVKTNNPNYITLRTHCAIIKNGKYAYPNGIGENHVHYNPVLKETRVIVKLYGEDGDTNIIGRDYDASDEYVNCSTYFDAIEIDGVDIPFNEIDTLEGKYNLSSEEHIIKYTLKDPTAILYTSFAFIYGITEVVIPDSVTTIGERAFYQNYGLTNVTIPDSVISIGVFAFGDCTGLSSISLPNVSSIETGAFEYSGLNTISIGDKLTYLEDSVFCTNVQHTDIYINTVIPPEMNGGPFCDNVTVYVPAESVNAYIEAADPNYAGYFQPMPTT